MLFIFFLLFKDISSNSGISVNDRIEKLKLLKESLENNDPNSDQIIEEFKEIDKSSFKKNPFCITEFSTPFSKSKISETKTIKEFYIPYKKCTLYIQFYKDVNISKIILPQELFKEVKITINIGMVDSLNVNKDGTFSKSFNSEEYRTRNLKIEFQSKTPFYLPSFDFE